MGVTRLSRSDQEPGRSRPRTERASGERTSYGSAVLMLATLFLAAGCGAGRSRSPDAGIPRALLAEARPIGHGSRFHPPAAGPVIGRCARGLGPRYGVHVEVFAGNRVVLIPAGIGTRPPRALSAGRISAAGCYGDLVTVEPTGVVLVRPGARRFHSRSVSRLGAAAVSSAVAVVSSVPWRQGRGVCRGAALAWAPRTRSVGEACGDRAGGRAVRPAPLVVHVPAWRLNAVRSTGRGGPGRCVCRRVNPGRGAPPVT